MAVFRIVYSFFRIVYSLLLKLQADHEMLGHTGSYPAGSESVVGSVVLLLACSVLEVVLELGSTEAAGPRASC